MVAGGYPATYYELPGDEQRRIGNAVRQRRRRSKKPPMAAPKPVRAIPVELVTGEWVADRFARLKAWTAGSDPRARKLRGREREFVKAAADYQSLSRALGRPPSLGEFAAKIGCTRPAAQNRSAGVGGPVSRPLARKNVTRCIRQRA